MVSKDQALISRRSFLKGTAALGGAALVAPLLEDAISSSQHGAWSAASHGLGEDYENYGAENVIYSMCHQCNSFCSVKAVVTSAPEGVPATSLVRKIAGNPYSPLNTVPFGSLPYDTPPEKAAAGTGDLGREGRSRRGGRTCLKGQAGIQTVYDQFRLQQPLKRVGPRGSGRWKTIGWEEALEEIVSGSRELGTPGLKDSWGYADREKTMADWEKVKKGEMAWEEFDKKYKTALIDTRHPDLGPKANQILCLGGDRRDFMRTRVWQQGLGSNGFLDHGGICGASSVVGNFRSFSGGTKRKDRLYPDLDHAEFVILWGTNPVVANKGPSWLAPTITNALARGMKLAVVDPRLSKSAEKAHLWLPIKPGADGALALALGRWIIENKRYDERYLCNPNQKAAALDKESTWTDATHLVNVSDPKRPKLRAKDLGLGDEQRFVVMQEGRPLPHDQATEGTLEVDQEIQGLRVKSVFTLYRERVMEKTLEEYATFCDLTVNQIVDLAREWTSHGKRSAMMVYRGPAMHTNGYYSMRAINTLNHLIGNHDWKGGSITTGAKYQDFVGPRYDLLKVPGGLKPWGVSLVRGGAVYEKSTLFQRDGYPARRPWYPFGANVIYEVVPSAQEAYPYPLKALFVYSKSIPMSMPQGWLQAEVLKDTRAIPLLVVSDVVLGETATYADFVLPDLSYLERWQRESIYPNVKVKVSHLTQPVTRVVPEARSIEDVFIEILKKMNLPGAGAGAFPGGGSLDRVDDFYLKMVANIAFDGTPVPDAGDREMGLFYRTRRQALGKYSG
ncbi:MAG: molybdopterin-dependent oxidoreductase [Firmicutes bacterium]|nr:molybdopterin-dependent oxidoreductase [Bacillota bacterium]